MADMVQDHRRDWWRDRRLDHGDNVNGKADTMIKKIEPFPTLLTKSDAMLYAAKRLEEQLADMEIIEIIKPIIAKPDFKMDTDEDREKLARFKVLSSGIVDFKLQRWAMRAAIKEIRDRANEIKLVEAVAAITVEKME